MKRTFLMSVIVFATLPFFIYADEVVNSTVHVNVHYQGSLVWSGDVSLPQGSMVSVSDNTNTPHSISSDSALNALVAADSLSSDFNLSDLAYYSDYDSFFINCIDVTAISKHACNNWQYVVNSTYPPVGVDKYNLSNNDTIYFYFGSPRRIHIPEPTNEINKDVSVLTQTYDYTRGSWLPLPGVNVGATQPNPNDPYSPIVLFSAMSGSNGVAELKISTPGIYNVGLENDYYYPSEVLTITPIQTVSTQSDTSRSSSGRTANTPEAQAPVTVEVKPELVTVDNSDKVFIIFDISIENFIKKYNEYKNTHSN